MIDVNIEQVREALKRFERASAWKVEAWLRQMADELERLREFREYCDKYHNGIYEQFDEWRQR